MTAFDWFSDIFVCPILAGDDASSGDSVKPAFGVKEWRLDKYEGDPPQPGETKLPFEYITGGDGLPTRRFTLGKVGDSFQYHEALRGTN